MQHKQQILRYTQHTEAIQVLGQAIDLLGHKDVEQAIKVLMSYRNHLQDSQGYRLEDYDPRLEQMRVR